MPQAGSDLFTLGSPHRDRNLFLEIGRDGGRKDITLMRGRTCRLYLLDSLLFLLGELIRGIRLPRGQALLVLHGDIIVYPLLKVFDDRSLVRSLGEQTCSEKKHKRPRRYAF